MNPTRSLMLKLAKRTAPAVLCLLAHSGAALAQTASPATEECQIQSKVDRTGKFTITLERAGGTGYDWSVELPKKNVIKLVKQGQHTPVGSTTGAPIKQWWKFQVMQSNPLAIDTKIHFYLSRIWEGKSKAAKHCVADLVFSAK